MGVKNWCKQFQITSILPLYLGREETEMLTILGGNVGDFTVPEM